MAMILLKGNVSSQNQTMLTLLILDVKFGTGIIKYVLNVLLNGLSTLKDSVFQCLMLVEKIMQQEPVFHAIRVMT